MQPVTEGRRAFRKDISERAHIYNRSVYPKALFALPDLSVSRYHYIATSHVPLQFGSYLMRIQVSYAWQ